jgi:hypothetical protein
MTSFSAKSAAPALDYDFNPHVKAKGTVPEPSQEAVEQFQEVILAILPDGDLDKLQNLSLAEGKAATLKFKEALADLCAGSPSREELDALPHRVLVAFSGWLSGSFQDPS